MREQPAFGRRVALVHEKSPGKELQGFRFATYVAGMTTLYTRDEAARRLHLAPNTLRRWAHLGRGPRFVRTGDVRGRTLYAEDDLAAWLEQRKQSPATTTKGGN